MKGPGDSSVIKFTVSDFFTANPGILYHLKCWLLRKDISSSVSSDDLNSSKREMSPATLHNATCNVNVILGNTLTAIHTTLQTVFILRASDTGALKKSC